MTNLRFRTTNDGEEFKLGTKWYNIADLFPPYNAEHNRASDTRNNILRMLDMRTYMWLTRKYNYNKKYSFKIKPTDIWIPPSCPITGDIFNGYSFGEPSYNSPSVDRIDNDKGYIKSNIWVIRNDWNKLKCEFTNKELRDFYFNHNADKMFDECGDKLNYDDLIEEDGFWIRYENMVLHLELLAYLKYSAITADKCVITKELEPNLMGLIERDIFTVEEYRNYFWDID